MSQFLKLQHMNGTIVWINFAHVSSFVRVQGDDKTRVYEHGNATPWEVREEPDQIGRLLMYGA